MKKYIDVEELIALIDAKLEDLGMSGSVWVGRSVLNELKEDIKSLQQEQLDIDEIKREWYNKGYLKGRKESNIPARELGLPKSCDMQEQPKVDLEKEIEEQINIYYNECEKKLNQMSDDDTDIGFLTLNNFARRFYELGLNARKEK